jgi:hypothetical protein
MAVFAENVAPLRPANEVFAVPVAVLHQQVSPDGHNESTELVQLIFVEPPAGPLPMIDIADGCAAKPAWADSIKPPKTSARLAHTIENFSVIALPPS